MNHSGLPPARLVSLAALRAYSAGVSQHSMAAPGLQTIAIRMVDPGLVIDQIIIKASNKAE